MQAEKGHLGSHSQAGAGRTWLLQEAATIFSCPLTSVFEMLVFSQDEPQAEKRYLLRPAAAPDLAPATGGMN